MRSCHCLWKRLLLVTAVLSLVQPTNAGLYSMLAANFAGTNYASLLNLSVLVPPPPVLTATHIAANQLYLAWPTGAVNYTLYSSSNLLPAVWIPVVPAPAISNGLFRAIISPTNSQPYYRLSQP